MKTTNKKSQILIAFCILILFLGLFFLYISGKEGESQSKIFDYADIKENGELVVVTDYSPMSYFVKGDTIEGFNYELLQLLQEHTDIKIKIELESNLQKSIEYLESGKYNLIARSIPITSDLKDKVQFTNPISQNRLVLVQRKAEYNDSILPIRSHLSLPQETIYVSKNSPAILRINNLAKEIGDTIHYIEDELYNDEQLAYMVALKEIDFAICDEKSAQIIAKNQPEIDIKTLIGFTQLEAWVVSKESPVLLDSINTWLAEVRKTKKYKQLYKTYYSK